MEILFVVVLYNENFWKTKFYKTLINDSCKVYIYDNSPIAMHLKQEFPVNWKYVSDPSNSGLSLAYNKAALYANEVGCQWLLIADQDTIFPKGIIEDYRDAICRHSNIKLFVPTMSVDGGEWYMSPIKKSFFPRLTRTVISGVQSLRKYVPINSGMMIAVDAFLLVGGYNENVKVDWSDYQFISRFRKYFDKFVVLDAVCIQNFSDKIQDNKQKLLRFEIFCESLKKFQSDSFIENIEVFVAVCRRTVSLIFKTSTIMPIKIFIKKYLL